MHTHTHHTSHTHHTHTHTTHTQLDSAIVCMIFFKKKTKKIEEAQRNGIWRRQINQIHAELLEDEEEEEKGE